MPCPPIIFLNFNRPEHSRRVFERIRAAQPSQLFLVADGPRTHVARDREACCAVREVISAVDWDCEVHKKFSEENIGCARGVATGITWAFTHVERAIILEDDCLPEMSFFRFCDDLLEKYAREEEVMAISGNHFLAPKLMPNESYYFLGTPLIWGWATWRRAWKNYPQFEDIGETLKALKKHKQNLCSWHEYYLLKNKLKQIKKGYLEAWGYVWSATLKTKEGLCACPSVNLVKNIGFDEQATHTGHKQVKDIFIQSGELAFPLKGPQEIKKNLEHELYIFRNYIQIPYWQQFKDLIARLIYYRYWKAWWHK